MYRDKADMYTCREEPVDRVETDGDADSEYDSDACSESSETDQDEDDCVTKHPTRTGSRRMTIPGIKQSTRFTWSWGRWLYAGDLRRSSWCPRPQLIFFYFYEYDWTYRFSSAEMPLDLYPRKLIALAPTFAKDLRSEWSLTNAAKKTQREWMLCPAIQCIDRRHCKYVAKRIRSKERHVAAGRLGCDCSQNLSIA